MGYEDHYEVSNFGKVRKVAGGQNSTFFRELSQRVTSRGYLLVSLRKNGDVKSFSAHRLVAQAFVLNQNDAPFVNHIDGNKSNNNASNLEWVTAKENMAHAISTGLRKSGDKYSRTVIHKEQLPVIYGLRQIGLSYAEIGEIVDVNSKTVVSRLRHDDYTRYYDKQEFKRLVSLFVEQNKEKYKRRDGRALLEGGKHIRGVIKLDKSGNIIERYDSVSEAAKAAGVCQSAISNNLIGRTKYCRGSLYVYEQRN